jgi:hypothetical protein
MWCSTKQGSNMTAVDSCTAPQFCQGGVRSYQFCSSSDGLSGCRYQTSDAQNIACGSCTDCTQAAAQVSTWCGGNLTGGTTGGSTSGGSTSGGSTSGGTTGGVEQCQATSCPNGGSTYEFCSNGSICRFRTSTGQSFYCASCGNCTTATNNITAWCGGTTGGTTGGTAIGVPGAALWGALAAVLRQHNVGLVIGKKTAGAAEIYKEFTLTNGIRLLIAVAPVKLEGSQALSRDGVEPDILVAVSEEDEKAYWEDPYRAISKRGSRAVSAEAVLPPGESSKIAQTSRRRMNEADLVRMQREGMDPDLDLPEVSSKTAESEKLLVRDPALARALDLLKGLAVVKQLRHP